MRKPTPQSELYSWWNAALASMKPPLHSEPHCGFFKRRLVKNGPWVPARIWMDQPVDADGNLTGDERMRCEVASRERDPVDQWLWLAGHPIPESEYRYLSSLKTWADAHAPDHPTADAKQKVDFTNTRIPF